ncbi:hypothetical protein [Tenacibaculum maritimum]|uniref:hypothetical protein n=1 Tax=Tenacibaculum maritimum TaxID=107401 RepID=UPI0013305C65|nr:hypothetical protein [Tenacibaculum maritimum]
MVSIFLKKFGYDCYTTENTIDESESCGKSDIDLRPFIPRQTQMSPDLFGWKLWSFHRIIEIWRN